MDMGRITGLKVGAAIVVAVTLAGIGLGVGFRAGGVVAEGLLEGLLGRVTVSARRAGLVLAGRVGAGMSLGRRLAGMCDDDGLRCGGARAATFAHAIDAFPEIRPDPVADLRRLAHNAAS